MLAATEKASLIWSERVRRASITLVGQHNGRTGPGDTEVPGGTAEVIVRVDVHAAAVGTLVNRLAGTVAGQPGAGVDNFLAGDAHRHDLSAIHLSRVSIFTEHDEQHVSGLALAADTTHPPTTVATAQITGRCQNAVHGQRVQSDARVRSSNRAATAAAGRCDKK
jgi:hypothetical protein